MKNSYIEAVFTAGEAFAVDFEFVENEVAFPITNYVAKIQLRAISPRGEVVQTWLDSSSAITRNNLAGKLTLNLLPAFTSTVDFKVGYLDCLLERADGSDGIRSETIELMVKRGVTDGN